MTAVEQPTRREPRAPSHVQLQRLLGRGAVGSVWAARHRDFGNVAIKLVEPELLIEFPEVEERLRFEAEAAWRIDSPNIAQVLERGMAGGVPYIVMELLEGQTLEAHLDEVGALPIQECVSILEQMARALSAAHAIGIVHRDLKPENVFLCDATLAPAVKLLDFGIAKRPTDSDMQLTRPGALLGTPYYMSREQLLCSADVDHRADLWALAVVAYELLTGEVPFHGSNLGYLIRSVFEGTLVPVSTQRPELREGGCAALLDAWFARAFDKDIERRFTSADQMIAALRAVLPSGGEEDLSGVRRIVRDDDYTVPPAEPPAVEVAAPVTSVPQVGQCAPEATTRSYIEDEPTAADLPLDGQSTKWAAVMAVAATGVLATLAAFL